MDHYLPTTLRKMTAVASIANAASVQFGWALQLSPLTPYIQLIGVPYKWAANISHNDARCPLCVGQVPGKIIVSILSGPWDSLFGGSNLPSFLVGALAAVVSGILAVIVLPTPTP